MTIAPIATETDAHRRARCDGFSSSGAGAPKIAPGTTHLLDQAAHGVAMAQQPRRVRMRLIVAEGLIGPRTLPDFITN
jgi:hypothetical protein